MARSLTVSHQYLDSVRRALQCKQFPSQRAIAAELGLAISTVSRFFTGKSVDYSIFVRLCEALNLDWEAVTTLPIQTALAKPVASPSPPSTSGTRICDWDGAMDVAGFLGRTTELATLERWIKTDRCRLVMLLGRGGIGKTSLAIKLGQTIQPDFEVLIWRSLRNAPPVLDILAELVRRLSGQSDVASFKTVDQGLAHLVPLLRNHRCLLLLDNVESILQSNGVGDIDEKRGYQSGYEGYGQLFQAMGETAHNSCLVLTSREPPPGIMAYAGAPLPVQCLPLAGLSVSTGQDLLAKRGKFTGSEANWQQLIDQYAGNPLALKIIAPFVSEYFEGNLAEFLTFIAESPFIFDDIRDLLDQQFQRLNPLEQATMYWLAINREPISLSDLLADFIPPISPGDLLQAIASLQNRCLIDSVEGNVTQQPVVMEYVTHRLVAQIYAELTTLGNSQSEAISPSPDLMVSPSPLPLLHTHALRKTKAKDYIQASQTRLILNAIAQRLMPCLSSCDVTQPIQAILHHLHTNPVLASGYAGGNLLNLCCHLNLDLSNCDFSQLTLRHPDLQGVKLHHLNFSQAEFVDAVFTQTFGNIVALAFSPDGTQIATGDSNNDIRLWRVGDGQPLMSLKGHKGWVCAIAFSPDGQTLVSGSVDYTVRRWDVTSGRCLQIWRGHQSVVWSVAFSPDGQTIVSGSEDQTIKLWQVNPAASLTSAAKSAAATPHHPLLQHCATALTQTDSQHSKACRTLKPQAGWVRAVTFSPDGKRLATGHADGGVRCWHTQTGKGQRLLKGHTAPVWSVAFSPDGQILATAGEDQTIRLWDIDRGHCLKVLQGHHDQVWAVRFSPDGQTLASGSLDHTVRLWRVQSGRCLSTLIDHRDQVWTLAFSPDGKTLASGSLDQTIRLWDLDTYQCLHTWHGHTNGIRALAFNPTGDTLVSGGDDAIAHAWNFQTSKCIQDFRGHHSGLWALAFSPDGETLATGGFDQTVRLWDTQTGLSHTTLHTEAGWVQGLAFHPNSQILASSHIQPIIQIWNRHTDQCISTLTGHTDQVWAITFSPEGQLLASTGADRTVRLWHHETGKCIHCFKDHTDWIYSVAFISQQTEGPGHGSCLLASAGADRTIKIWQIESGKCLYTLEGHQDWIYAIAPHPSGQYLASVSRDQTVRIWDMQTQNCIHTWRHDAPLWSVAFHPQGHTLACGGEDEVITLWHVETGRRYQSFQMPKPYEAMNITGTKGLTAAQRTTLKALGAIDLNKPEQA